MTPKQEGHAGDVPIHEVPDSNVHSLSTQRAGISDKSEAENGELQVAREWSSAQTVADTERYIEPLLPPILVLTFLPIDLNEMRRRRTPTKTNVPLPLPSFKPSPNFLIPQAPHDPRPDPPIHQELLRRPELLRPRCQCLSNETTLRTFTSLFRLHERAALGRVCRRRRTQNHRCHKQKS